MTLPPGPIDLTTLANFKSWLGIQPNDAQGNPNTSEDLNIQLCLTAASDEIHRRSGRANPDGSMPTQSSFIQSVSLNEFYDGSGSDRQFVRITPINSVTSVTVSGVAVPQSADHVAPGWVIDNSKQSLALIGGGSRFIGMSAYQLTGNRFRVPYGWAFGSGQSKQDVQIVYSAGYQGAAVTGELQNIPTSSGPYTTVTVQYLWLSDAGVSYQSGGTLTKVGSNPIAGQYVVLGAGVYQFSESDAGKVVAISYAQSGVPYNMQMALIQMVAVNYKRKDWIDQASRAMAAGAGTTSYRSWEMPPEIVSVIQGYTRKAIIY